MIAKHSNEQSEKGEGVEVMKNEKCEHPVHGHGQFTEKRVHLSRQAVISVIIINYYKLLLTVTVACNASPKDMGSLYVTYNHALYVSDITEYLFYMV